MIANPFLGVLLHAIGGLCSAVFYLPFRRVRGWSWETYWLVGGIASWMLMPWLLAALMVPDLLAVLSSAPASSLRWSYIFGALWGFGGLSFGLTIRYLGIALGTAMALGYCAIFGTLMPPIFSGEFDSVAATTAGKVILAGVGVCLAGIAINGWAGISKQHDLPNNKSAATIPEFNFRRGVLVAAFCGIASASMAYGFAAGKPIADLALQKGTPALWTNLPVLVVVLLGGFTTNFIWCVGLNLRKNTWRNYFGKVGNDQTATTPGAANENLNVNTLSLNYTFAALAGVIWYLQFFFYGMGTTQMGRYDFSSWTLHMAFIMIFGTLCGVILKEWAGIGRKTAALVVIGLATLVTSTLVVGYGNYLGVARTTP